MGIAKMKVDGDVGIKRQKLRQDGCDAEHAERKRGCKSYVAARRCRLRDDFAFGSFTFQKDVSSAVVKLTSGFCHREAARGAIE